MSSPQPPLEEEEPDDSEDWQIFEIRALGYELFETPSKPEAPNMAGVRQIEDHPWTYVSARMDRPEVVIEGSDTDSASQLDETLSQPEDSNSDTEMHFKESLPNPLVFKTGGDRQIEDYPRTCASASVGNQQDVILIENSDNEAFKPQGVLHIKEHQRAHVPSPARSRQDLVVVKVFTMGGESKLDETLPKAEATDTYGESQGYETLPKPETFYMDSESQTAPKSEYNKTLPKPQTFYVGRESQAAPKSKTLPKPETFYMDSESQTAPKSEYNKTLPKPETFYMGNESQAVPKSEDLEPEGLHEDLIEIMREFNLDVYRTTQCLFFNSGEVGSTKHFLRTGLRPDGYPIWEPMDDEDLKKNKPKLRARLVKKYGEENVAKRLAFLEC